MRVATYRRISTDESNQPYSMSSQQERLTKFAESQDDWEIVADYKDHMTGSRIDRPGLQAMLNDARLGRFDLLVVLKVDRLTRSVGDLMTIINTLTKNDVEFRSSTEGFETGTPAGVLMLQMLGGFAEFERSMIIDRVNAGIQRKVETGGWGGGTPPMGYKPQDGVLYPDPEFSPIVNLIFNKYVHERLGCHALANFLNSSGIKTRRGKQFEHKQILKILRNRHYVGEVHYEGNWLPGTHEPIIDKDLFDQAQTLLAQRSGNIAARAANGSEYLLSGVVKCDSCNRSMTGSSAHGSTRSYRYYQCSGKQRYGKSMCAGARVSAPGLEEAVLQQLCELLEQTGLVADAVTQLGAEAERTKQDISIEIAAIKAERTKATDAVDRYFQAFEIGSLNPELCQQRVNEKNDQIEEMDTRLAELADEANKSMPTLTQSTINQIHANVRESIYTGDLKQQKKLVAALVQQVAVQDKHNIKPVYRIPTDSAELNLVRAESSRVGAKGLEPLTSSL